jgi:hypothetical protein
MTEMLKTLLASTSLALALLFVPLGSVGPLVTTGAAGLAPAHADFGIELGGVTLGDGDEGPEIGLGIGDDDGGDDEDDGGDDDDDE